MKLAMIAASLVLAGSAQAQSLKENYNLQDRCDELSAQRFTKDYGNGSNPANGEKWWASYEDHYNARLNKCFFLLTVDTDVRSVGRNRMVTLYDLNEDTEIANFTKMEGDPLRGFCFGQGMPENASCGTERHWRAMIKSYMED